jgi:hypothetical protein
VCDLDEFVKQHPTYEGICSKTLGTSWVYSRDGSTSDYNGKGEEYTFQSKDTVTLRYLGDKLEIQALTKMNTISIRPGSKMHFGV